MDSLQVMQTRKCADDILCTCYMLMKLPSNPVKIISFLQVGMSRCFNSAVFRTLIYSNSHAHLHVVTSTINAIFLLANYSPRKTWKKDPSFKCCIFKLVSVTKWMLQWLHAFKLLHMPNDDRRPRALQKTYWNTIGIISRKRTRWLSHT